MVLNEWNNIIAEDKVRVKHTCVTKFVAEMKKRSIVYVRTSPDRQEVSLLATKLIQCGIYCMQLQKSHNLNQ